MDPVTGVRRVLGRLWGGDYPFRLAALSCAIAAYYTYALHRPEEGLVLAGLIAASPIVYRPTLRLLALLGRGIDSVPLLNKAAKPNSALPLFLMVSFWGCLFWLLGLFLPRPEAVVSESERYIQAGAWFGLFSWANFHLDDTRWQHHALVQLQKRLGPTLDSALQADLNDPKRGAPLAFNLVELTLRMEMLEREVVRLGGKPPT